MKYILIGFLSLALMSSCNKEEDNSDLRFIFGSYAGECFGNCATLYLLTEDNLYADEVDYYNLSIEDLAFQSQALNNTKYELAKTFYENIPNELIQSNQDVFGIPDAYDQGGYLISITVDGSTQSWTIDTNRDVLPDYLKSYTEKLIILLEQLI